MRPYGCVEFKDPSWGRILIEKGRHLETSQAEEDILDGIEAHVHDAEHDCYAGHLCFDCDPEYGDGPFDTLWGELGLSYTEARELGLL